MGFIDTMLYWFMKKRVHQIELFKKYPIDTQNEVRMNLLQTASNTYVGKLYGFNSINNYRQFQEQIPVIKYEDFHPLIERARKGEESVIWPGKIKWFAKSSGTTNAKSKFIPITTESLNDGHYKAGKDMFSLYAHNHPNTDIFNKKNLRLGGSSEIYKNYGSAYGDLSAILIDNLPFWAEFKNTPDRKVSLMPEWETKIQAIISQVLKEDVGSLTGVPSWMLVLLHKILEYTKEENIHKVWKGMEVFFHGGISFKPYESQYNLIFEKALNFYEIYNASEGFFGLQDQPNSKDLLLLLDHGIFYEFIDMKDYHKDNPKVISLEEVEKNINYAMIITTNGGLWRYSIGDTVRFTCLNPFRIVVTGRTKHFINAFGEELVVDNAEEALKIVQEKTHSSIKDYTAGPIFMEGNEKGGHEWIIEFIEPPKDLDTFTFLFDETLQALNSDYEAKRYKNITLNPPKINIAPKDFFNNWMKERGKLGGQNKVPRLSNDREYIDPLLEKLR